MVNYAQEKSQRRHSTVIKKPRKSRTGLSPLLTVDEVAALFNYSPRTIRRMANRGKIPFIRIGAQLRFDSHELRRRFGLSKEE